MIHLPSEPLLAARRSAPASRPAPSRVSALIAAIATVIATLTLAPPPAAAHPWEAPAPPGVEGGVEAPLLDRSRGYPPARNAAGGDDERVASGPEGWDYLKPVGGLLFSNMVFWATARYVMQAHYAYISPSTMLHNFREGFEWDADDFPTNQIGHPYQGGLYHAGARTVGFGFWGSVPYTMLGSLQWEMFMENELPSFNDLVTTTVGGVVMGEVLFRLSSALLDESKGGFGRAAREGGALALSPIHGLGRLVSGAASRDGTLRLEQPMDLRFGLGVEDFRPADLERGIPNLGFEARTAYGSFVDDGQPFKPFDWFTLGVSLNYSQRHDFYAAQLDITGLLARWRLPCGSSNDCAWGPMLHYDYYDTPSFKVGTSALGLSAMGHFDLRFWELELYAQLDLGAIALGGFDSPYAEVVARDYNLGSGGLARTVLVLRKPGWFQWRTISSRYYVRTLHGAAGHELAGISRSELEVPLYRGLGVSLGSVVYDRLGVPDDYERVTSSHILSRLQVVWRVAL